MPPGVPWRSVHAHTQKVCCKHIVIYIYNYFPIRLLVLLCSYRLEIIVIILRCKVHGSRNNRVYVLVI